MNVNKPQGILNLDGLENKIEILSRRTDLSNKATEQNKVYFDINLHRKFKPLLQLKAPTDFL